MIRLTFSAVILTSLIIIAGCSKESNVVAPSGSTITVSASSTGITAGNPVTVYAVVMDSNGKPMNAVAVTFSSSAPLVASLSATAGTAQKIISTNDSGIATATVTTFAATTGSANITANVGGASGSVSLTVN